jgi:hypothetical protein
MAVKIPIVTVFDSKGLRQAQYQLNKVSGNISNLNRNFAIAGAAFAGIAVGLGKSVKVASDLSESINAVNVAFGSSAKGILDFGKTAATTLGVSSLDFNNAAVRFSAFAERIVGKGGDASKFIREITTRASDFASVFNIEVSEALQVFQSGLAGEAEPLKRFGINLLDTEVKAYAVRAEIIKQGETMTEQQKVLARYGLLMESTNKTAGDFANTSSGLANASRILNAQIVGLQGEIGDALLPAIEQLMPVVQQLTLDFGDKLKTAVASVDWGNLLKSLSDLLIFLVQNIETIMRVVTAMFLLNTAYNVGKVAVGLYSAATLILKTAMDATTTSAKLLRTALFLGGVTLAVGSVIDEYRKLKTAIQESNSEISKFNTESIAVSGAAAKLSPIATLWQNITKAILGAVTAQRQFSGSGGGGTAGRTSVLDDYAYNLKTNQPVPKTNAGGIIPNILSGGGGGKTAKQPTFAQSLKKQVTLSKKAGKLVAAGLSEGLAQAITSSNKPVKAANKILARITKNGQKAVNKLQGQFNQTASGRAEIQSIQAQLDADQQALDQKQLLADQEIDRQQDELDRKEEERLREEAAALAERERIYKAFADSVKNTFSQIKDQILDAFTIPQLGNSTESIIRNMDKLLTRLKAFSGNITKLSSMGLDPKLLQQVINAGPIAGAKLAANLVAGGVGGLAAINAGYSELAGVSGEIGMTGTQSLFGTQQQQTIYNLTVEGGLDSPASIGKAVVDAIKAYERTSGAVFQGA